MDPPGQELQLLSEVLREVGHAHAFAPIVLGLARVLQARWPLLAAELRVHDDEQLVSLVVTAKASRVERLVPTEAPDETPPPGWTESPGEAARWRLVLPLEAPREQVVLRLAARPEVDGQLVEALACVLRVAVSHARLVARVAAVSRRALADSREAREELQRASEPLVTSAGLQRALHAVAHVAPRRTTVLVRGESGTGKELIARKIHILSPRAPRPLVKVNCGALPEALIESILFGHEKGAFSGAVARHEGVFERADHGTLFLDEVAELPPSAQVKLLRVLQEGEFERVGGTRPLRVDVRVIAATHRDLEQMVERGEFREDLYYRLNVFPIDLPPLRLRTADLGPLSAALVLRLSHRLGVEPPRLSARALQQLAQHDWPGNVRELENVLERALVLTTGDELELPPDFASRRSPITSPAPTTYRATLQRCIEDALTRSGGRIYGPGGAAEELGMRPTTLQSTMARLGIRRAAFVRR